MVEIAASAVAVIGTLAGGVLGFYFQGRLSARDAESAKRERRREEFVSTVAGLVTALGSLIQVEYDRAKRRAGGESGTGRELARQEAYDMRTSARTALHRLQLTGNPTHDGAILTSAERVLNLSRDISSGTDGMSEVDAASRAAKKALDELVELANSRIQAL